jgi:hypothetical protein
VSADQGTMIESMRKGVRPARSRDVQSCGNPAILRIAITRDRRSARAAWPPAPFRMNSRVVFQGLVDLADGSVPLRASRRNPHVTNRRRPSPIAMFTREHANE